MLALALELLPLKLRQQKVKELRTMTPSAPAYALTMKAG